MNDTDWQTWSENHCAVFGLNRPEDVSMVDAWRDVFAQQGFTVRELKAATLAMATDPPKTRMDNLAGIQASVRGARSAQIKAELQQQANFPSRQDCPRCQGTSGGALVPHPHSIKGGKWIHPFYTLWVYCSCPAGMAKLSNHDKSYEDMKPERKRETTREKCVGMTLVAYEDKFPKWKEMVKEREDLHRAEVLARRATEEVDKKFGNAVRSVMRQATVEPKQMPAPSFEDEALPSGDEGVPF